VRIRSPFRSVLSAALLLSLVLPLTACGLADTQTWKSGRRLYYTYVNTPAKLDLDEPVLPSEADKCLSARLMEIDTQLTALERTLDALTGMPADAEAAGSLLRRFPWLSGLVAVDPVGNIMASIPGIPLKQLDFTPLLEPGPKTAARTVRTAVQDTPLGPEIMVARPFMNGPDLEALLIATFDFRALLPYVQSPGDLVVRSPDVLLWSGDLHYDQTPLNAVDWEQTLRKSSYGELESSTGSYVWLTRYLGLVPLVFATPLPADGED